MRAISFETFKESCKRLDVDIFIESGKFHCNHACNTEVASISKYYKYTPCTEKNCPVLGGCKKL